MLSTIYSKQIAIRYTCDCDVYQLIAMGYLDINWVAEEKYAEKYSRSVTITDHIRFVLVAITSNNLHITGKCLKSTQRCVLFIITINSSISVTI